MIGLLLSSVAAAVCYSTVCGEKCKKEGKGAGCKSKRMRSAIPCSGHASTSGRSIALTAQLAARHASQIRLGSAANSNYVPHSVLLRPIAAASVDAASPAKKRGRPKKQTPSTPPLDIDQSPELIEDNAPKMPKVDPIFQLSC